MSILDAIILGILQGLTEFLPVSSSGHLVLAQKILRFSSPPIFFDILLHFATFMATLVILRKTILRLLRAIPRLPHFGKRIFQKGHLAITDDADSWMIIMLLVSTFITGVIGLSFEDFFKSFFGSTLFVGFALLLTGTILFLTRFIKEGARFRKQRSAAQMTIKDAAGIGLAQALAIFPGISRSGSTICAGLFLGLDRKLAGEYAFLVSLPAIFGATLLEWKDAPKVASEEVLAMSLGCLAAFLVGSFALFFLLKWIRGGKLAIFAFYCWIVGLLTIFFSFYEVGNHF